MSGIITVLSNTTNLLKELQRVLPLLTFSQVINPDTDTNLKQSKVIVADFDLIGPHLYNLPNVRWIQGTWAGTDALMPFINKSDPPKFPISRFSGDAFGALMGEYVLANVINYERDFFKVKDNQRKQMWSTDGKISDYRAIGDMTFGILGLGNIGSRIGKILQGLGGTIYGYGRKPTIDKNEYDFVEQYFTKSTLPCLLKSCDYIINVMPKTNDTTDLLSGDILKNCLDKQTVFINIGRGNIISEESLIKALKENWIQAAILDVFEGEPLSKESELWNLPNVFITPHVSGQSRAKDVAVQFKKNLEQFENNKTIPNIIDFQKGY